MGLPFPARQRQAVHYFPIFATVLMLASIISICVWIHYTQVVIFSIRGALDVVDTAATADNYYVLSQSVVATSVLFMIYACVIFGLCLWRALLEAEIDQLGEVKDKLQLYQMANLGVRICWVAIMTWIVLLMAGCAILGVYVSNMAYMVKVRLRRNVVMPVMRVIVRRSKRLLNSAERGRGKSNIRDMIPL
ncbi:hypothetical protein Vafri_5682 [Volvox africanus]|nr:hypothetical protein Vafri_5682 [Volvox africanus]